MTIKKMTSKELNGILNSAQDSIKTVQENVKNIKDDMLEKTLVLHNEYEWSLSELARISTIIDNSADGNKLNGLSNKIPFFKNQELEGIYTQYGSTVHAQFARPPLNVFNLMTSTGPMFRNNMIVSINDTKKEKYKQILMHTASIEKGVVFEEYDSPNIALEIEIDTNNILGDTTFNVLEINPYMAGSFDIEAIEIYTKSDEFKNEPEIIMTGIKKCGPCRILLDRKYELLKVKIEILLRHKNHAEKYPFGLKHLYFLQADFNPHSYVISKVAKNNFIETISDEIILQTPFGKDETTLTKEKIQLYLTNRNGVLEYELQPSRSDEENIIARSTKEFFVRIPLNSYAITSLEFDRIKTR